MSTHYEILGVEQNASLEAIKSAYRRIQLQTHPDKTKDLREPERSQREALSKAANVAWEILSDEGEKAKYDETLFYPPLPDEPVPSSEPEPSFGSNLPRRPPTPQDQYFNNFQNHAANHPHPSFWAGGIPSHFPNTNFFPSHPTSPPRLRRRSLTSSPTRTMAGSSRSRPPRAAAALSSSTIASPKKAMSLSSGRNFQTPSRYSQPRTTSPSP